MSVRQYVTNGVASVRQYVTNGVVSVRQYVDQSCGERQTALHELSVSTVTVNDANGQLQVSAVCWVWRCTCSAGVAAYRGS